MEQPMSTITKEQVKDLRNAFQCWQQDYDPVEDKEQYDMFGLGIVGMDALLASLEAEKARKHHSVIAEQLAHVLSGMDATDHQRAVISCAIDRLNNVAEILQRSPSALPAPPAPVSMPDEDLLHMAASAIEDLLSNKDRSGAGVWSDIPAKLSRAAMLQGAESVSNRDELPDGWVACSERMPEDEQEVITHNIFGYRHVSFFDEHSGHFFDRLDGSPVDCVEHVLVSHWMPIPAAPQQEA
jgi:hypothetical protein